MLLASFNSSSELCSLPAVFSSTTGDFLGVAGGDTSYSATENFFCEDIIADYFSNIRTVQEYCTNVTRYDPCLISVRLQIS